MAEHRFRSDLFYRLAVIEVHVPTLEERGAEEKLAVFRALLQEVIDTEGLPPLPTLPFWLTNTVAHIRFDGNIREMRNLAERVGVTARQLGDWNCERVQEILRRSAARASSRCPAHGEAEDFDRLRLESQERERILAALEAHEWRRQATADALHMSRKGLWEKMRKYQIGEHEQPSEHAEHAAD